MMDSLMCCVTISHGVPRSTHRRRYLELLSTGFLGLFAGCASSGDGSGDGSAGGYGSGATSGDTGSAAPQSDGDLGMTAGGAQDVGDFRNNLQEGYLPVPESLSYEGLFSEYYFDTGDGGECESLFCAAYSPGVSPDPLAGDAERFFTVGLDSGRSLAEFERPALNLVIVLDVSGSMGDQFSDYYYDPATGEEREVEGETDRQKLAVARDALLTLTEQLRPGDRLGIVLFSDGADRYHELQDVADTSMPSLRDDIESIGPRGGTNVESGIDLGLDMLEPYRNVDRSTYENRIVVVTDAQPNLGDTTSAGLRGTLVDAAEAGQHTSFVGVGVDFNPELVDRISSIRGANYYTVRSAEQFTRRMGEEFQFMVTPLVFDLTVGIEGDGAEIVEVYGTSVDDAATSALMEVPTLFPSPQEDGRTKGGVILVQVANDDGGASPTVTASYETRDGYQRVDTASVTFPTASGEQFANSGVRKSVLLARYGNLLRNWMIHERDESLVEGEGDIDVPPEDGLGRWEQTSEDLRVTPPYVQRIRSFREHFRTVATEIDDEELMQEVDAMDRILAARTETASAESDDAAAGSRSAADGSEGASIARRSSQTFPLR